MTEKILEVKGTVHKEKEFCYSIIVWGEDDEAMGVLVIPKEHEVLKKVVITIERS